MVFGALLAQSAVRLGAEDSTIGQPPHEYGGVGPYSTSAGRFTAPATGAYAIFAVGFSPADRTAASPAAARRSGRPSRSPSRRATTAAMPPPIPGWRPCGCRRPVGGRSTAARPTRRRPTWSVTCRRSGARWAR
ncbi:hypothetical protein V2I01_20725 [Micromonospora sp. BRA006-A]|nr:hypothetical protein [Micromonospora sp. BRA006-A]